jgi:ABC-2 type transport system ATP-binding protein
MPGSSWAELRPKALVPWKRGEEEIMGAAEPIIRILELGKVFGDVTAVKGLNLEIRTGEIFGLVGPDGAGKSTALRMLAGLLYPSAGSALVCGCDVVSQSTELKDQIGYMAQRFGLYHDLTVEENMRFYADLFDVPRERWSELTERMLKMTRMHPFRQRQAGKLSGGMKQKLALMCALLHEPRVLLLDEPTNGVDPVSRRDFWVILYELLKSGMTVVVSTAYLDEAERCNRVGLMHRGRLIVCDAPNRLAEAVEEEFLEVRCRDHRQARSLLAGAPGVLSAEPSGAGLHVFWSPQHTSREGLIRILDEAGLGPVSVAAIEPSIEDLFIALVNKEVQEAT